MFKMILSAIVAVGFSAAFAQDNAAPAAGADKKMDAPAAEKKMDAPAADKKMDKMDKKAAKGGKKKHKHEDAH